MRNKYENGFEFGWQQRRACDADSQVLYELTKMAGVRLTQKRVAEA